MHTTFDEKLGIVNRIDRPCENLIAEVMYTSGNKVFCKYISFNKRHYITLETTKEEFTSLKDFGVTIIFDNGKYSVKQIGESSATYSDGTPRRWQGDGIEVSYAGV